MVNIMLMLTGYLQRSTQLRMAGWKASASDCPTCFSAADNFLQRGAQLCAAYAYEKPLCTRHVCSQMKSDQAMQSKKEVDIPSPVGSSVLEGLRQFIECTTRNVLFQLPTCFAA